MALKTTNEPAPWNHALLIVSCLTGAIGQAAQQRAAPQVGTVVSVPCGNMHMEGFLAMRVRRTTSKTVHYLRALLTASGQIGVIGALAPYHAMAAKGVATVSNA